MAARKRVSQPRSLPLTEEVHPSTGDLDALDTHQLLHRINDEDRRVAWAVEREIDALAAAVDAIVARLRSRGRLHYFGAGTSGRIAMLDAAEIPPTFSEHGLVQAHIAGGVRALTRAVEAAEDDARAGEREVRAAGIGPRDAVVGLSASGSARYVLGALRAARKRGALTIGITSSPDTPLLAAVDIPIVLRTGPEVIAGSTRMKAGSAQKMALTMLSTAVMIKLGKVHGNLMVDLKPTNEKLRARAVRLAMLLSGAREADVQRALAASGYNVKTAVLMVRGRLGTRAARARLASSKGNLRSALASFSSAIPKRRS